MLIVTVKVVPSSGRNQWILDKTGTIKCYLKSPAERGLANQELIKLFAKALGITQNDVEIVAGATVRTKRITLCSVLTFEQLLAKLGIERQQSLL
ncbi:MAG TPA: DUF167 domain-containing protein [Candidatus Babeliales bacterium]|nr:DUF167 domain-containing protein [Candidatus Babeliales bacterium]